MVDESMSKRVNESMCQVRKMKICHYKRKYKNNVNTVQSTFHAEALFMKIEEAPTTT